MTIVLLQNGVYDQYQLPFCITSFFRRSGIEVSFFSDTGIKMLSKVCGRKLVEYKSHLLVLNNM